MDYYNEGRHHAYVNPSVQRNELVTLELLRHTTCFAPPRHLKLIPAEVPH